MLCQLGIQLAEKKQFTFQIQHSIQLYTSSYILYRMFHFLHKITTLPKVDQQECKIKDRQKYGTQHFFYIHQKYYT